MPFTTKLTINNKEIHCVSAVDLIQMPLPGNECYMIMTIDLNRTLLTDIMASDVLTITIGNNTEVIDHTFTLVEYKATGMSAYVKLQVERK